MTFDVILEYLTGYVKYGFYMYTLAGILLFFMYCVFSDSLAKNAGRSILLTLFGGYAVTLLAVMISPQSAFQGAFSPLDWFSPSAWTGGGIVSFTPSRWRFDLALPESWDAFVDSGLGNLLADLPFGLFVPLIWEKISYKTFLIALGVIVGIEVLQIFFIRSFGLCDIAIAFLGFVLGFLVALVIKYVILPIKQKAGPSKKGGKK